MAMRDRPIEARDVEAYFQGVYDVLVALGVHDGVDKRYDPLTIDGDVAWSYVFDLHDGGRQHSIPSYEALMESAVAEAVAEIRAD